jgi:tetratricopeptide (TPR) repeat protein
MAMWFWRARRALKAGRVDAAAVFIEMIEEVAPAHPGLEAFRKEALDAALNLARQRAREDPENPEWRGDLARALTEGEQYEEASEQVRAGLRLLEHDDRGPLLRAEMLQIAGEIEYHLGHYERCLDLMTRGEEPGFAMGGIHYCRGLAWLALGDRRACRREFVPLVGQAHWVVGWRYQEFLRKRAQG